MQFQLFKGNQKNKYFHLVTPNNHSADDRGNGLATTFRRLRTLLPFPSLKQAVFPRNDNKMRKWSIPLFRHKQEIEIYSQNKTDESYFLTPFFTAGSLI